MKKRLGVSHVTKIRTFVWDPSPSYAKYGNFFFNFEKWAIFLNLFRRLRRGHST